MNLVIIKLLSTLIIFVFTIIFGLFIIFKDSFKFDNNKFSFINCLVGGLFFSISFMNLLNNSNNNLNLVLKEYNLKNNYPWVFFIFVLSFILILIIDKILFKLNDDKNSNYLVLNDIQEDFDYNLDNIEKNCYENLDLENETEKYSEKYIINTNSFCLLLFIYSFFEGTVLGWIINKQDFLIIFYSILIHKFNECLKIRKFLFNSEINTKLMPTFIMVYSLILPLGIIFGSILINNNFKILKNILLSFTGGMFFYIITVEILDNEFSNLDKKWVKILFFIFGFSVNSYFFAFYFI